MKYTLAYALSDEGKFVAKMYVRTDLISRVYVDPCFSIYDRHTYLRCHIEESLCEWYIRREDFEKIQ